MDSYFELVLRCLFAVQMVFWGLNGFFNWITVPPPPSAAFARFLDACHETQFILPVTKIMEMLCGIFLLLGFLVPASLLALAPIIFVIAGLHIFHNPKPWTVLGTCVLPYLILLAIHGPTMLRVVH